MFEYIDMLSMGIRQQPQTVIPTEQLDSDVGDRVICGIMMMPLCNGWGWQPTQTASRIHLRHKQSVWAHWYAVLGHIAAALHSYTQTSWVRCWGTESLVESNDGIMSSLHRYTPTLLLGSYFGVLVLGRPWSQNDGIMSLLRLTAPSNCYLHPS